MKALGIAIGIGITVYSIYDHWPLGLIILNVVMDVYAVLSFIRES